ncbi:alcohol dehydrogenase catalytic domain-containing protein [Chloroflexota bacterium]
MKAMMLRELGGPLKFEEVEVPKVGPGEALVRVAACGVGYTVSRTRRRGIVPRIPGHEVAGQIVEVGEGVVNVKEGDRVAVYFYLNCGTCKYCRIGRETLCLNLGGLIGVDTDGGYAEYTKLPAQNCIKLPQEISYLDGSIVADAICTPWKVMKERAKVKPLDDVLIVGAGGGVGIHAVAMARLFGGRVIAADISEEKLKAARKAGAEAAINTKTKVLDEEAKRLTGGKGMDVVIDFTGIPQMLEAGLNSLAIAGRLVTLAGGSVPNVDMSKVSFGELVITGSRYVTKQELTETIEVVRRGMIKAIIGKTFPLEEADVAHQMVDQNKVVGRAALVIWEGE